MTPYHADPWLTVYLGDCRDLMAQMASESVHCVVTSPPYWGLRDYGTAGQLGLEPTPEQYVENMVAVFREVRRVLRSDGTVWLNLGDSYASHDPGGYRPGEHLNPGGRAAAKGSGRNRAGIYGRNIGLKPKDLVGIPWRVAFALQADGWYLRSDVIWSKPNPMPESVTDRPTKAHEYLFLLSKSPRYYFDADAVREAVVREWDENNIGPNNRINTGVLEGRVLGRETDPHGGLSRTLPNPAGRNIRTVWTIATQPYPGAHFATFPRKLVEPCIKAGTSEGGVCPECGAPWERVVERESAPPEVFTRRNAPTDGYLRHGYAVNGELVGGGGKLQKWRDEHPPATTGWRPSCRCEHDGGGWVPVPATVLDPFAGSGTTAMVAQSLSRRAVLIDLNGDYLEQVMDRNRDIPLGLGA